MQTFYNIVGKIKTLLEADVNVNTVTKGMNSDIDNAKQNVYPLSHVQINEATVEGNLWRFSITTYHLDQLDVTKDPETDKYIGNDDEDDIMNSQLAVFNRMYELLRKGADTATYQMDGNPVCLPGNARFDNGLSGWECTFDILTPNVMTKCDGAAILSACADAQVRSTLSTYITTVLSGEVLVLPDITHIDTDGTPTPTEAQQPFTCSAGASATYSIKDSAAVVLYSGSIASGGSLDQTITDATVNNSDATYTDVVEAQGTLVLPDSTVNVNAVNEGSVVSVKDIDVSITDGASPVTPSSVVIVGTAVTITVPTGGSSVGATLMRTGLTTSYRTGDDSDTSSEGRATDVLTLDSVNPFSNLFRFTDELGTQTFANDIVIDWSTYNGTDVLGMSRVAIATGNTWDQAIDNSLSYSIGSFTSGWRLANIKEIMNLTNYVNTQGNLLNYSPLNLSSSGRVYWSSTTAIAIPTTAYAFSNVGQISRPSKTASTALTYFPVRTFTVTGTTLT